jgi:hypothetical protein
MLALVELWSAMGRFLWVFGRFGFDGVWYMDLWHWVVGVCGVLRGLPIIWLISLQWRLLLRPLVLFLDGVWWLGD